MARVFSERTKKTPFFVHFFQIGREKYREYTDYRENMHKNGRIVDFFGDGVDMVWGLCYNRAESE